MSVLGVTSISKKEIPHNQRPDLWNLAALGINDEDIEIVDSHLSSLDAKFGSVKDPYLSLILTNNCLTPACLGKVSQWLDKYKWLHIDLSTNYIGFSDLQIIFDDDDKHRTKWIEENRVTLAPTTLHRFTELSLTKMSDAVRQLAKETKDIKFWREAEDDAIETEMKQTVTSYYKRVDAKVFDLKINVLYRTNGDLMIEFDGLLSIKHGHHRGSQQLLVPIEVKHHLTTEKVKDRCDRLNEFRQFLIGLAESEANILNEKNAVAAELLSKRAQDKIVPFIGGIVIDDGVDVFAKRNGFSIIKSCGSRFDIEGSTKIWDSI